MAAAAPTDAGGISNARVTIAIYAISVALALLCIGLFFVAARRLLGRQEEIIVTMLRRYDDRLGEFAQTLNDALNREPLPAAAQPPLEPVRSSADAIPEHGVMRVLELARKRMAVGRGRRSRVRSEPRADTRHRRALAGGGCAGRPHGRARLPGGPGAPGGLQRRRRDATRACADSRRPRRPVACDRAVARNARRADESARSAIQRERHHHARGRRGRNAPRARAVARAPRAGPGARARLAHRALRPAGVPRPARARDRARPLVATAALAAHARRRPADDAERPRRTPGRGRGARADREAPPRRRG